MGIDTECRLVTTQVEGAFSVRHEKLFGKLLQ